MNYASVYECKTIAIYNNLYTVLDPLGNSDQRDTFYYATHKLGFNQRYKRADNLIHMLRDYSYIEMTNYNV